MASRFGILLVLAAAAGPPMAAAPKAVYRIDTVAGTANPGDGGPATAAQIGNMQAVTVDRFGNLYLSDTDNHRIRKVSAAGIITTVAGTGIAGFSGDGGPAAGAQLNLPYGLALDPAGYLYVADLGNHRLRRIRPDGIITTIAGNGTKGSAGDGGPAADAQLLTPRNLALDAAGNIYIAEFEGHRVRKISPDGRISTVAGVGIMGFRGDGGPAAIAQLAYPAGLAVDRAGAIYVADSQNQRIRKILPGGIIVTVIGATVATGVLTPIAVAVDSAGTIYVADASNTIRAFLTTGAWITVAGTGIPGFSGDGAPARLAALTSARDLAVDLAGALYIADGVRIRKINANAVISTVAGDGYLHNVGDGGNASAAPLFRPAAVARDSLGNLYLADAGTQRIRKITASGQIWTAAGNGVPGYTGESTPAASAPVNTPLGIAFDSAIGLVFADTGNHRIRQVAADGRMFTILGTGVPGVGEEESWPLLTPLRGPRGLCTGPMGILYVVDTANHRILRAAPGATVVTVAGNGSPGDGGDNGPARLAELRQPAACKVDPAGNLFIADTGNHRIRKVTASGIITTFAGTGLEGSSGDEGAAIAARLSAPAGVSADDAGNVYIADTGNHRIRQVTPDGVIHHIAGTGAAGFAGDAGPALTAQLNSPQGLALDSTGALYFADTFNDRIRVLTPGLPLPPEEVILLPQLTAVNTASLLPGSAAPGEMLTIFGTAIGPEIGITGTVDAAGMLATNAGGAEVRFDGVPAPLFYAQAGQVNVQVPYTVAGAAETHLEIFFNSKIAGSMTLPVAEAAPALFPVIVNPDGSPNSQNEPAPRDTVVTLYGTGEGITDGPNRSGQIAAAPFPQPKLPVSLMVAGINAQILFAGSAPGYVGMLQINARVPGGFVPPGRSEVRLTVGGVTSAPVGIWLK